MKNIVGTLILVFGLSQLAIAGPSVRNGAAYDDLERVGDIVVLDGIYSWNDVDDDSIIVWTTPFQPFLVNLAQKSHELRFSNSIAVTTTAGHVYEKFDSVIVHGLRYPIRSIYKLDRASAKDLRRSS